MLVLRWMMWHSNRQRVYAARYGRIHEIRHTRGYAVYLSVSRDRAAGKRRRRGENICVRNGGDHGGVWDLGVWETKQTISEQ